MRCADISQTPRFLGLEILSLAKMNWNTTEFDNAFLITVKAARDVGNILRYIDPDDRIEPRYSYYM